MGEVTTECLIKTPQSVFIVSLSSSPLIRRVASISEGYRMIHRPVIVHGHISVYGFRTVWFLMDPERNIKDHILRKILTEEKIFLNMYSFTCFNTGLNIKLHFIKFVTF